eukprot:5123553-Lingulodinium_polyedra.AAC.1
MAAHLVRCRGGWVLHFVTDSDYVTKKVAKCRGRGWAPCVPSSHADLWVRAAGVCRAIEALDAVLAPLHKA